MSWASKSGNYMVTFTDLQSSPFSLNPGQSAVTSNRCITKAEALTLYNLDSSPMSGKISNQLVPKYTFLAGGGGGPVTTYYSVYKTISLTKTSPCPPGKMGGSGSFWIPYGSYTSTVDQATANALAQADLDANAQNSINGVAIPPGSSGQVIEGDCIQYDLIFGNGFSPNGDGINDVFKIARPTSSGVNIEATYSDYPNSSMTILLSTHYGATPETVFEQISTTYTPWNGKRFNTGTNCPETVQETSTNMYYYTFKYGDGTGREKKSYIVLKR